MKQEAHYKINAMIYDSIEKLQNFFGMDLSRFPSAIHLSGLVHHPWQR